MNDNEAERWAAKAYHRQSLKRHTRRTTVVLIMSVLIGGLLFGLRPHDHLMAGQPKILASQANHHDHGDRTKRPAGMLPAVLSVSPRRHP
jgi:hypothetical protein